jgi:hypothetical protein
MLADSADGAFHHVQQLRVLLSYASHVEKCSSPRIHKNPRNFASSRKQTKYSFHFLELGLAGGLLPPLYETFQIVYSVIGPRNLGLFFCFKVT